LRMMKAALGLGTKCREVVTIDFGNVCHVSNFSETRRTRQEIRTCYRCDVAHMTKLFQFAEKVMH
jgi:hypothetical protein